MATVTIDGQAVELPEEGRLNGIQAAALAGISIPHYCWHPGLSVVASCRMCLVETGRRDASSGEISMFPKLQPACQTPATDGTVFVTDSDKVTNARAMVEEDLLIRHPIDCPICDKAGECYLQDYHFQHGRESRRADLKPFTSRRRNLGETVTLFVDRCVMCSRCVRFCREVSGTSELMVANRGTNEEIDVFPGFPLDNKMSGNVVDLCPVGALGDRDFLYKQRVWFLKQHSGICTGCATGCSITIEENQERIHRLKPLENPAVNQWWICDEGRYGWKHVHDSGRLKNPRRRGSSEWEFVEWDELSQELTQRMREVGRLAAVLSPHLTVEEAFLLSMFIRQIDPAAPLATGPVPRSGRDEQFDSGFRIRAEKCPNRRGVEEVIGAMGTEPVTWETFLDQTESGSFDGVWVSGGYKTDWNNEEDAKRFSDVPLLIVQDLFSSPLSESATYQLPGASFAERSGSYVNADDLLQWADWAVRPPEGVTVEGQLYWRLADRSGLYDSAQLLDELAGRSEFFMAAAERAGQTTLKTRSR